MSETPLAQSQPQSSTGLDLTARHGARDDRNPGTHWSWGQTGATSQPAPGHGSCNSPVMCAMEGMLSGGEKRLLVDPTVTTQRTQLPSVMPLAHVFPSDRRFSFGLLQRQPLLPIEATADLSRYWDKTSGLSPYVTPGAALLPSSASKGSYRHAVCHRGVGRRWGLCPSASALLRATAGQRATRSPEICLGTAAGEKIMNKSVPVGITKLDNFTGRVADDCGCVPHLVPC